MAKTSGSSRSIREPKANPLVVEVVRLLRERKQTVSFAESCTGGVLSAVLTRLPGVSDVFVGAVVGYSYAVKESLLLVPAPLLRAHGAVSIPVARKMAAGAKQQMQSTWSVSVTGIAGPGGGTAKKPVGTICFGVAGPGVEEALQRHFSGTRREIQLASARFALRFLRWQLLHGPGYLSDSRSQK